MFSLFSTSGGRSRSHGSVDKVCWYREMLMYLHPPCAPPSGKQVHSDFSLNMRLAFRVLISIWKRTRSRRVTLDRAFRGSPVRRLREYCVVPSPLSARMACFEILPSNLQCFRASDAQSVRVRYTNQTKHAFGLRVAYVYRPKLIKIQYPAPDSDRHPEFSPDPDLIHIW